MCRNSDCCINLHLPIKCLIALQLMFYVNASKRYKYESSYAFLTVQNGVDTSISRQFCANFQQWKTKDLPSSTLEMINLHIDWWNLLNSTNVCEQRNGSEQFASDALVPADYRTTREQLKKCEFANSTGRIYPIFSQVELMKNQGIKNVLFLMQKGAQNGYGLRNYLFTHFYNAEINDTGTTLNVFYVYDNLFWNEIKPLLSPHPNGTSLGFYQPNSPFPMDPAVILLWLFAFISILIGSYWAATEIREKVTIRLNNENENTGIGSSNSQTELTITVDDGDLVGREQNPQNPVSAAAVSTNNSMKRSGSTELAQMNGCQHCISVIISLFIVVAVLMLAFFFRDYAVHAFNVFTVILGIFSLHSCLYTILKWMVGDRDIALGYLRTLFCCFQRNPATDENARPVSASANPSTAPIANTKQKKFLDRPIYLLSQLVYIFSIGICVCWYILRDNPYAFLLLNPINIAICIYSIRASRIRSLRFITFLLLAMFAYDLFMVFGTRLLTPDGCSVMMQVVTGVDCRPSGASKHRDGDDQQRYQPIAPIEANIPEKLPLLFYMPMIADPMSQCYDVQVEREFKHVLLGLGDVILPGYLIAYCFYVDAVRRNPYHTYGLISMLGYSVGMLCTFAALLLMETGQPALLYLVPFTLVPVSLWAFFGDSVKGTFGQMWHGQI